MCNLIEKNIKNNKIQILKLIIKYLLKLNINLNYSYVDVSFKENDCVKVSYLYDGNDNDDIFFKKEHFLENILKSKVEIISITTTIENDGTNVIKEYKREYNFKNNSNQEYEIFLLNFIKKINGILFSPNDKYLISSILKNPEDILDDLINLEILKNGEYKVEYFEAIGMLDKHKVLIFGLKKRNLKLKEELIKERKNYKLKNNVDYGLTI